MTKKALLTGINNYKYISDLRGCVNDVHNIRRLLTESLGFPAENIRTLVDDRVTKENVLKEWKWLLKNAKPGDNLVFHFSGHGSYINDDDGDETDGVDELLCLYDMDFGDRDTYLLDDELRKLTGQTPKGVFLTVILDNCHSGTATRMLFSPDDSRAPSDPQKVPLVDDRDSEARAFAGAFRSVTTAEDAPRDVVLVRFVEPPLEVQRALRQFGTRGSLRQSRAGETDKMNHVLWAGSRDNQTAADAHIDNDYNGAFSFHFCEAVRRAGSGVDHQELLRDVRSALVTSRFSQVPQLEPETTHGPLLNWGTKGEPSPAVEGESSREEWPASFRDELLQVLRDIRDSLHPSRAGGAGVRAAGRALVYVHGICFHESTYAEPWWAAMKGHLSGPLRAELESNRYAILWSDLVNRSRAARLDETPEERQVAELIKEVMADRAERQAVEGTSPQPPDVRPIPVPPVTERAILGIPGLDCVDDFTKYLLNDGVRDAVQMRFLNEVRPLLRSGAVIDVISHSFGTVVAYEALRRLDGDSLPGHVRNLFTVGAALSIRPVRSRMRPGDGQRPRHVRRWVNLDARGDIVGGPLQGFQVDLEFPNLHPTDCRERLTLVSPSCAHSSYFKSGNHPVNRDIFARFIETP